MAHPRLAGWVASWPPVGATVPAVPEWLFQLVNPWTTPAALLIGVVVIGWLAGLRDRRWAGLAALVAAGVALWQAWKIGPPSGLLDLQIYVGAARGWLHGRSLYDYRDGVHHLGATYPPIGPVVFTLFVPMAAEAREVLWTALSLTALGATAWFVAELAGIERRRRVTWAVWAFAAAVVTIPVWLTLRLGQVNIVLWLLVVADVAAVGRRYRWSGVGIGVATAVKLVPGLFVVWLVLAGKRAAAGRAVAAVGAATLLGWLLAPSDSKDYWTKLVFDSERIGRVDDARNGSLLAVVVRLVGVGPIRTVSWLGLAGAIVVVGLVRGRRAARRGDLLAATAVVGCAASLISPISWTHHLGFLVLALAALATTPSLAGPTVPAPRHLRLGPRHVALGVAWLFLVDPGELGANPVTATLRAGAMVAVVAALPIVDRRSAPSGGDDTEDPVDELAAAGLEVVALDRHAAEYVGPPVDHED